MPKVHSKYAGFSKLFWLTLITQAQVTYDVAFLLTISHCHSIYVFVGNVVFITLRNG